MKCIITIELGTNAVRIFAFDLNGVAIGSMKGYYPTFHSQPDYSEQDPEQIFITMLYVLKNLLNENIHPKKYKVASICFSSSMHSTLAVDKHAFRWVMHLPGPLKKRHWRLRRHHLQTRCIKVRARRCIPCHPC
jgi:sugar (pentulose or hexulose) kinase